MTKLDFSIESLGEAKIPSPIKMSDLNGDGFADYVSDDDRILYCIDTVKNAPLKFVSENKNTAVEAFVAAPAGGVFMWAFRRPEKINRSVFFCPLRVFS